MTSNPESTPFAEDLVRIWRELREASAAHRAAVKANPRAGSPAGWRLDLPTWGDVARAQGAWRDAVPAYRAATQRPPTDAAYVQWNCGWFHAVCPVHPGMRHVAWPKPGEPIRAAASHNRRYHGGVPVRTYARQ